MKYFFAILLLLLLCRGSYAQVIVTVAGTGIGGYSGDGGPATNAKMNSPFALAFDKDGNFYFSDDSYPRIRKVSPSGIITVLAGVNTSGFSGDGGQAIYAEIRGGGGLCVDKNGNVFLADGSNHRIRKITTDGIIRTIAGTGISGYNGEGIPATDAQLNYPQGVAVDDTGNVYICDRMNFRLRKIDTAGVISTIAGTGVAGFTPDGARADTAAIDENWCIVRDTVGNIFFTDKSRIRKITAGSGMLTTVAGNGTNAYSGDGGHATAAAIGTQLFTIDSVGNLFLAEGGECRIRKVSTDGSISTVTGNGLVGVDAEGVSLSLARVNYPSSVSFSPTGDLYFTDKGGGKVRKITLAWDGVNEVSAKDNRLELFPNPARHTVSISVRSEAEEASVAVADVTGAVVARKTITCNVAHTIATPWPKGIYMVGVVVGDATITKQVYID
jgi:hypothetical protein